MTTELPKVELAIMGGSGFAEIAGVDIIQIITPEKLEGPFGQPSGSITIGKFASKLIAFMCRHGNGHQFNPTYINYRANVWALVMLGVKKCFGISACGSLTNLIQVGTLTVPDQLFDNTKLRPRTFFQAAVHVSMADPFCNSARNELINMTKAVKLPVHDYATYVIFSVLFL